MAKDGYGKSSQPEKARLGQSVSSPADPTPPLPRGRPRKETPLPSLDVELCAAAEKSQLEFQRIFGVTLKAARAKAKLNQAETAALTGLTQQYLSLIEAGQQNVTVRTMALLAKVVDHDLMHLLRTVLKPPEKK
jgi:DNA-binding XRE family transcriptional regulator